MAKEKNVRTNQKQWISQTLALIMLFLVVNMPISYAITINPESISVSTGEDTALVTWETDKSVESTLFYGLTTTNLEEVTSAEGLSHAILLEQLASGTKYYFKLTAKDETGSYTTNIDDFTTLLPSPTGLKTTQVTHDTIGLSWNKVENAKKYEVKLNNEQKAVPTSNEVAIQDLTAKTTYAITVSAIDSLGQKSVPAELSVTTQEEPVTLSFIQATNITKTSAVVSWKTEKAANGSVYYSGTSTSNLDQSLHDEYDKTAHTFTLKGLEEDTTYHYKVKSDDTESDQYQFTTLSSAAPIEIKDIQVRDITRNSAEISWVTNVETTSTVVYGMDDSLSQRESLSEKVLYHTIELKNLNSGATYYYKVIADNQESEILSFQTSDSLSDFIDLEPTPELINTIYLDVEGNAVDGAKLYFFVNKDLGRSVQTIIPELNGTHFNVTLQLDPFTSRNGTKGSNLIEIDGWDAEGNKAMTQFFVTVDNEAPSLHVYDVPKYTNENTIMIIGESDPDAYITITLNDQSKAVMTVNATGGFSKTIDVGTATKEQTLAVIASDQAGNKETWTQTLVVDKQDPTIEWYTEFSGTTHYKLFKMQGKTEPNAWVRVTNFGEYTGCDDAEFLKEFGKCSKVPETKGTADALSLTLDAMNLALGQTVVTQADDAGNFSVIIPLFSGQDVHTEKYAALAEKYRNAYNIIGTNNLIFNITDQAGNIGISKRTVKYEPGCPDWVTGKITSFPFNIYTEDLAAGEISGSAIIELKYIGAGTPKKVQIAVQEDKTGGSVFTENKLEIGTKDSPVSISKSYGGLTNGNQYISIGANYKKTDFDPAQRNMYVYIPLKIHKYAGDVTTLPDQMGVYLDVKFNFEDYSGQVASCDAYPVLSFDVQKPESLSKWLSPEMINSTINALDGAINITQTSVDILEKAAIWTTVACGAKLIWDYASGLFGGTADTSNPELNQCGGIDMKTTYEICDRILCPSINPVCDGLQPYGEQGNYMVGNEKYETSEQYLAQKAVNDKYDAAFGEDYKQAYTKTGISKESYYAQIGQSSDPAIKAKYNEVYTNTGTGYTSIRAPRTYATTFDEKQVTVQIIGLDETLPQFGDKKAKDVFAKDLVNCPNADVKSLIIYRGLESDKNDESWFASSVMTQDVKVACSSDQPDNIDPTNAKIPGCYKEGCPEYDETKCLIGTGAGHTPTDGLLISLQCGCLPGAKAHLENLLKILQSTKTCLQSAMIGQETAGACKRLFSYFLCDILTEVMKYIIAGVKNASIESRSATYGSAGSDYKAYSQSLSKNIKGRYGPVIGRAGLTTDSLVNKACIAAINLDWSELEGVLDTVVDTVEVAPMIAGDAYSRPYGYDPFTGRISIGYNLYVGIVPGGLTYLNARLECDRSYPGGEYCAKGVESTPVNLVAKGKIPSQLTKDAFFNENIFYIDENAVSWYNKFVLEITYQSGDKQERVVKEYEIRKKGDIALGTCQVSAINGISCQIAPEFNDITGAALGTVLLYSNNQGSRLSPKVTTYTKENQVSAIVKIGNGYTAKDFYIRSNNNVDNLQYYANAGTDTNDYRATQYYLLWLDNDRGAASTTSTEANGASASLDTWSKDHPNEGFVRLANYDGTIVQTEGRMGIELNSDFDRVKFKLIPGSSDTNTFGMTITCDVERDTVGNYKYPYGVFINGKWYDIDTTSEALAQSSWEGICKVEGVRDLNSDCAKEWKDVPDKETKYKRTVTANGKNYYMCIMPTDIISTQQKIKATQITQLHYIAFDDSRLKPTTTKAAYYRFGITYAITYVNNDPNKKQDYITTAYLTGPQGTSTTSTGGAVAAKQSKINVLSDTNGDSCGESRIYSSDADKARNQEFTFEYAIQSNQPTGKLRPVIDFVEPVTVIEQATGFVNNDNREVPIGITAWDDRNSISEISIGILRNDQKTCQWIYIYDKEKNLLIKKVNTGTCTLTPTSRTLGFQTGMPPFFEFDLSVDGDFVKNGPDNLYDITISVMDDDGNPSEPVTKRICFDQVKDQTQMYMKEDMFLCLGSGACENGFDPAKKECSNAEIAPTAEEVAYTSSLPASAYDVVDVTYESVEEIPPTYFTYGVYSDDEIEEEITPIPEAIKKDLEAAQELEAQPEAPIKPTMLATGYPLPQPSSDRIAAMKKISTTYEPTIRSAVKTYKNVPVSLVAGVIAWESGADPNAISKYKCKGLMQFCSSTAELYGLKGKDFDYRFDATKSIHAGTHLLSNLIAMFDSYSDSYEFALASYNGGEGVVFIAIKNAKKATGKSNPSWAEVEKYITPEAVKLANTNKKTGKVREYVDTVEEQKAKVKEIRDYVSYVHRQEKYYAEEHLNSQSVIGWGSDSW